MSLQVCAVHSDFFQRKQYEKGEKKHMQKPLQTVSILNQMSKLTTIVMGRK